MQKIPNATHGICGKCLRLRILKFSLKKINYKFIFKKTKAQNKNEEAIQTQIVGQACVEKLALNIFQKADEEDRQARFSK